MSVNALAWPPVEGRRALARLAIGFVAVALVAAASALLLYFLQPAAPPGPATPPPFGGGVREQAPAGTGLGQVLLVWQKLFFEALRNAILALKTDPAGLPTLLLVGAAYGVFHAAGPGHGKAVIASYIVSSEAALKRGIGLSVAAALIQALVAIGLVTIVFGIVGATAAAMGRTVYVVELFGFGLVAAMGAALVWRKAGRVLAIAGQGRAAPDPCACEHVEPARLERASVRELAGVALGAGMRPCAGAIVVLTFTRAQGVYGAGLATTFAMALGTALTTGALACLAVFGKRLALRLAGGRGGWSSLLGAAAELAAAAFILVIGLALLAGVWGGSGPT